MPNNNARFLEETNAINYETSPKTDEVFSKDISSNPQKEGDCHPKTEQDFQLPVIKVLSEDAADPFLPGITEEIEKPVVDDVSILLVDESCNVYSNFACGPVMIFYFVFPGLYITLFQ